MFILMKLVKVNNVIYKIKKEKNLIFCYLKLVYDQYGKIVGLGFGKEFIFICYDVGNVYFILFFVIEEFFEGFNCV